MFLSEKVTGLASPDFKNIARGLIMQRQVAGVLLILCFLLMLTSLSGCGLKYVEVKHPEKFNSIRLTDPNNSPFEITESNKDTNKRLIRRHSSKIILEKPCRVNYRKLDFNYAKLVRVTGRLPNGKEYPVIIDSGCTGAEIVLNDVVVKENDLETLFSDSNTDQQELSLAQKRSQGGLCFLPQLKIGELIIQKPWCAYVPWHREFQLFGLPLWQDKQLFLGISIMSRFRYIHFDNTKMQLEFSYNHSFHPGKPIKWAQYPFVLQEKEGGGNRIMVDIPIAGETCNIYFDTGGSGTVIMPGMWEKIRERITATTPKQSKFLTYQHGSLPCHKVVAKMLSVGNVAIKNAEIVIMPKGTPYLPKDVPGYVSIWTFKDTSVVLDFERNLMWIKNQESK